MAVADILEAAADALEKGSCRRDNGARSCSLIRARGEDECSRVVAGEAW